MPTPKPSPGSKVRARLEIPNSTVSLPYTRIVGPMPGPNLLVTGGVHGGEYPGIESAIRFAQALDPNRIRGSVTVVHMANPPAFFAKAQYLVPEDGKNLNRVFPGRTDGTLAERIASSVMSLARECQYWVDLHGGDIHEALTPFVIYSDQGGREVVERSRAMAQAYGIPYILESSSIGGSTYATGAGIGIPSILAEAGGAGQLEESAVQTHLRGLENILRLLELVPDPVSNTEESPILRQFVWNHADTAGLFYPKVRVGQQIRAGAVAGRIRDEYGDLIEDVVAPQSGVVLFVVTSLAINRGDPLFAVAGE